MGNSITRAAVRWRSRWRSLGWTNIEDSAPGVPQEFLDLHDALHHWLNAPPDPSREAEVHLWHRSISEHLLSYLDDRCPHPAGPAAFCQHHRRALTKETPHG